MALTRLDDSDQRSFLKQAVATAGVIGAAAFGLTRSQKLLAEGAPRLNRFLSSVGEDMAGMKRKDFTAAKIGGLLNKHVLKDDSTWKRLGKEMSSGKMKINTTGNNLMSTLIRQKELQANSNKIAGKLFNAEFSEFISKKVTDEYGLKGENLSSLRKAVKEAVERDNLVKYRKDGGIILNDDFMEKYSRLGSSTPGNIFFKIADSIEGSREKQWGDFQKRNMDQDGVYNFVKNMQNQFTAKNIKDSLGTEEDNPIKRALKYKDTLSKLNKENAVNELKGRRMNINDFRKNIDKFEDQEILIGGEKFGLKDMLLDFIDNNKDSDIGNIVFDDNFRLNKDGDILNYTETNKIKNRLDRRLAGTLPGKLMKLSDGLNAQTAPTVDIIQKGLSSYNIESGSILENNYAKIMNKLYKINDTGELSEMKEFNNATFMSAKHGTVPRLFKKMFGAESEFVAGSEISRIFDIGRTTETNVIDEMNRQPGIGGKIFRKLFGGSQYSVSDDLLKIEKYGDADTYRERVKEMGRIMGHVVDSPSNSSIEAMKEYTKSNISREILEALSGGDREEILKILDSKKDNIKNNDLVSLVRKGLTDREAAENMISIRSTTSTSKSVKTFDDVLRTEVFKDVLLREAYDGDSINYDNIFTAINSSGMNEIDSKKSKELAMWAAFQSEGMLLGSNKNTKDVDMIERANKQVWLLLSGEGNNRYQHVDFSNESRDFIQRIGDLRGDLDENIETAFRRSADYVSEEETMNTIVMKKGYDAKSYLFDMLRDMNDTTKMKAHSKRFGMQFVAGRDSKEFITEYTMAPYFFTERLIEPFNKFGLGFSNENMGSTLDMWKNIGLKRVLPVGLAIGYGSYFNDQIKNITGTSVTGAFAQGVANVDLGLRRIADITGIGNNLEKDRIFNPISQYWFGKDYQNYEERQDYYENGYDAVRKGRWWSFGSAAEFRGGKISYFEPNFVKRANSDYRDISLYGSTDAKWRRSWLPNLHNLGIGGAVANVVDPYWLERKHYEDRPYMQSGTLFSEGTPWGAVLNPTVGEVLKPIRRMHQDETRYGILKDPRTMIRDRNERIMEQARDKNEENIFSITNQGVSNVKYTPMAETNSGQTLTTYRVSDKGITAVDYNGVEYPSSVTNISDVRIDNTGLLGGTYAATGIALPDKASYGIGEAIGSTSIGQGIQNIMAQMTPIDQIRSVNAGIMQRSSAREEGFSRQVNLSQVPARAMAEKITGKQDAADLRLTTSRQELISDVVFSGKQLSGIYGFLASQVTPDSRRVRPENSGKMYSFKTSFWDANIGGLGGGIMEISRRFFPHEDRSWTDVNPIRNTMPEWLPERFLTGDPFRKVQKGEMRLPGAGYETIHQLRSDEYGRYGALDRMRILGDIAPWSDEYKMWRDVAQKTVTDAEGKAEIKAIKDRVEQQSRSHDFYDYKFMKNPTVKERVFVDQIEGNKIVDTQGRTISLAGVQLGKDVDLSNFMVSGQEITIERLKDSNGNNFSASFYVKGANLSRQLVSSGVATKKEDMDTMDTKSLADGAADRFWGTTLEAISHAPIPFVHSKLLKVETPLESYKNERLYGTSYSTWDHPVQGFIKPAFQKSFGRSLVGQGAAVGTWALAEAVWSNVDKISDATGLKESSINKMASVAMNIANPGAFSASMIAAVPTGMMSETGAVQQMLSTAVFGAGAEAGLGRNAARAGAAIMLAGYGLGKTRNPIQSTLAFAGAGLAASKQLQIEGVGGKTGAMVGAAVGLGISLFRNSNWDNARSMFEEYTPEDTRRRRDLEEYFDRLEYIKWEGLYKKAARKAKFWEGIDIAAIIDSNEYASKYNAKRIKNIENRLDKIANSSMDEERKQALTYKLTSQIDQLQNAEVTLRGGKYTKAAIAYKQASNSTIYGLNENSKSQDVLRAIPKADKDFFMEFIKEEDPKERKKIMKAISPYQRRALQIAWGEKPDKVESNRAYFGKHFMPGTFWAGWRPQVDMESVKIKTIQNEGMMLSDFGIYDSQKNEPSVMAAPSVGAQFDRRSDIGVTANLISSLNGMGLVGTKVAVSPSSANGIQVIANIVEGGRILDYNARKAINKFTGVSMFY